MACEISVKIKGQTRTLTQKSFCSNNVTADMEDPAIDNLIKTARQNFNEEVQKITVTIKVTE